MISKRTKGMIRIIRERLAAWYEGEHIPDDPTSGFVRLPGPYKRSLSARALRCLVRFWEAHWQWCIPLGTSIILALRRR